MPPSSLIHLARAPVMGVLDTVHVAVEVSDDIGTVSTGMRSAKRSSSAVISEASIAIVPEAANVVETICAVVTEALMAAPLASVRLGSELPGVSVPFTITISVAVPWF